MIFSDAVSSMAALANESSFLTSVPACGDGYVLKSIEHDGTLLVLEAVLPEQTAAGWGSILDWRCWSASAAGSEPAANSPASSRRYWPRGH
jgi:hypothetical protein